jgi:hypothetical protein
MDSYIDSPESHQAAVKNPAMLGGPFMDFDRNRVEDVKRLRDRTLEKRKNLVSLSRATEQLDALLREKARGYSLEPIYAEVPPCLDGYVELVYDLNQHPSFRLIEPLLYKSPVYDPSLQSVVLSEIQGDDRPFILSTPRLDEDDSVHLRIPFESKQLDSLFLMKTQPSSFKKACDMLALSGEQAERFRSFLTTDAPPPYAKYEGSGARWRNFWS